MTVLRILRIGRLLDHGVVAFRALKSIKKGETLVLARTFSNASEVQQDFSNTIKIIGNGKSTRDPTFNVGKIVAKSNTSICIPQMTSKLSRQD